MKLAWIGWVLVTALGCTTSSDVVPIAELPELQRSVLVDYGRGGEVWDARRAEVRANPELTRFLVDNLVVELMRGFHLGSVATTGGRQAAFERAQAELVRFGDESAPVLAELLGAPDFMTAFCAVDTLKRVGRPAVVPTTLLLEHSDWRARQRAAELLAALPHAASGEPTVFAALTEALEDDEWIVRAQVAKTLGERGARGRELGPTREVLVRALDDDDPAVVRNAAAGLGALGDPGAIQALVATLASGHHAGDLRLVNEAEQALVAITGRHSVRSVAEWQRIAGEQPASSR